MLLIALSLRSGFVLPVDRVKAWYGISRDTAGRGLHTLRENRLLFAHDERKKAPLAPDGFTQERHYYLQTPFRTARVPVPAELGHP